MHLLKYQSEATIARLNKFARIYLANRKYKNDLYWWAKAISEAGLTEREKALAFKIDDAGKLKELLKI